MIEARTFFPMERLDTTVEAAKEPKKRPEEPRRIEAMHLDTWIADELLPADEEDAPPAEKTAPAMPSPQETC